MRSARKLLLRHGLAFALEFCRLVQALEPPAPVRCIIAVNDTNGAFRFHQIRPGEGWNSPDLDAHREDKMIVVDERALVPLRSGTSAGLGAVGGDPLSARRGGGGPGGTYRRLGGRPAAGRPAAARVARRNRVYGCFSGTHCYVLDYLADEVLEGQPGQAREFLLETPVLPGPVLRAFGEHPAAGDPGAASRGHAELAHRRTAGGQPRTVKRTSATSLASSARPTAPRPSPGPASSA